MASRNHTTRQGRGEASFSDQELDALERQYPEGMNVQQVVEIFTRRGHRLTESTFRKYVQLGLLPRSVRVARGGRRRGSQGLYPTASVRQLVRIRELMKQGNTIEEIQQEFLFVRGDIDALRRQLDRVYVAFEESFAKSPDRDLDAALVEARASGLVLMEKLEAMERRVTLRARMERAVV